MPRVLVAFIFLNKLHFYFYFFLSGNSWNYFLLHKEKLGVYVLGEAALQLCWFLLNLFWIF